MLYSLRQESAPGQGRVERRSSKNGQRYFERQRSADHGRGRPVCARCRAERGHLHPAPVLASGSAGRGRVQAVRRGDRRSGQAGLLVHDRGRGGHGRHDEIRAARPSAQGRARAHHGRPPARLHGLQGLRRLRAAGHVAVPRRPAHPHGGHLRREKDEPHLHGQHDRHPRERALHPVRPLRARVQQRPRRRRHRLPEEG